MQESGQRQLSSGAVAGIVIAVLVIVAVVILVIVIGIIFLKLHLNNPEIEEPITLDPIPNGLQEQEQGEEQGQVPKHEQQE